MQVFLNATRLLCGLSPLLLVGCLSGTPYPYNGYNGYAPGTYTVPPGGGTLPPTGGQNVVPQPRDGSLGQPGSPGGTQGSGIRAPQPGGRKPTYEANNNRKNAPGNKLVPNYQDPNKVPSGSPDGNRTGAGDNSGLGRGTNSSASPSSRSEDEEGGVQSPFGPGADANNSPRNTLTGTTPRNATAGTIRLANGEQKQPPAAPPRFQPPRQVRPVDTSHSPSPPADSTPAPKRTGDAPPPNPYDYDRKNYTWLRGKVDYDDATQTWQIIYSLNPDDQYGGTLTLVDDPKLKILRNDDVVLIEGQLEEGSKDARGKPRYRIGQLFGPLVPKSQLPGNPFPGSAPTTSAGQPTQKPAQ